MAKRTNPFESLAEARGVPVVGGAFEVTHCDRTWRVTRVPGGKNQPPQVKVALETRALPPMTLRRETRWDVLGKRLQINRELQTGEREFDALVYVESDVAYDLVRELLGAPGFRPAARELIQAGWTLALDRNGLHVRASIDPKAEVLQARFEAALDPLAAIAEACARQPEGSFRMLPGKHAPAVAIVGSIVVLIVGAVGMPWGEANLRLVESKALLWAALLGGPLWLAAVGALYVYVRGRSTSLRALGVSASLLLFGAPLLSVAGTLFANALLDGSPSVEHRTTVVSSRVGTGKNRVYHLRLASWREGSGSVDVKVRYPVYSRLRQPGTPILLRMRAGALGLPWIEGLEAAEGRLLERR